MKEQLKTRRNYSSFNNHVKLKPLRLTVWSHYEVRERESLDTENDSRCRECLWFDPAYDRCRFYGAARADDMACENFQPAE